MTIENSVSDDFLSTFVDGLTFSIATSGCVTMCCTIHQSKKV